MAKKGVLIFLIGLCAAMSVWASKNSRLQPDRTADGTPIATSAVATSASSEPTSSQAPAYPNVGVIEVSHPEKFDRVIALSDVHGMYPHLINLLLRTRLISVSKYVEDGKAKIKIHWTGGKSLLVVVGDSVDKGPDSVDVINLWINLIPEINAAGGSFIHVLGNHEAEFIADPNNHKAVDFMAELRSKNLVDNFTNPFGTGPAFAPARFLRIMPLAARVGNWMFCHAGLYPKMNWAAFKTKAKETLSAGDYASDFITGDGSILEAQEWWDDANLRKSLEELLTQNHFFGVVFGHQDHAFHARKDQVAAVDGMRLIKIDVGMKPDYGNPGELLIFAKPAQMNTLVAPEVFALPPDGNLRAVISK